VLDPACGTGNFLYVSMVKLKEIEAEARDWLAQLGETQTDLENMERTVDPQQFLGIEINPRAVAIAEVVLWIGWLQWHLRDKKSPKSFSEPILQAYGNIECRDALLECDKKELVRDESGKPVTRWDGVTMKKHPVTGEDVPDDSARVAVERYVNPRKAEWPQADFVVGNPPFIGNKRMRAVLGDDYTATPRATYDDVPETADYVMYWWDKAARLTRAGALRRFGLITTNSITQTFNRKIVAEHVDAATSPLGISFAIADHPWVDAAEGAAVRVAMTAGAAAAPRGRLIEVLEELGSEEDSASLLRDKAFGKISPDLEVGTAAAASECDSLVANRDLCFQGCKLAGKGFLVDGPTHERLSAESPQATRCLRTLVAGSDITKTPERRYVIDLFGLSETDARRQFPAGLQLAHDRVKPDQNGPCFLPFPFPAATEAQQQKIRELGESLDVHRKKQQAAHPGLTITGMYNVLEKLRSGEALTAKEKKIHDDGLVSVLKKIHDDLDTAVFDAYGWPATLSDDEILERLVALNRERAAEEKRGLIRWLRPEFQTRNRPRRMPRASPRSRPARSRRRRPSSPGPRISPSRRRPCGRCSRHPAAS
jgi:hypothetical protein